MDTMDHDFKAGRPSIPALSGATNMAPRVFTPRVPKPRNSAPVLSFMSQNTGAHGQAFKGHMDENFMSAAPELMSNNIKVQPFKMFPPGTSMRASLRAPHVVLSNSKMKQEHSSPTLLFNEGASSMDLDDSEITEIMQRKMKEVSSAKAQLNEERSINVELNEKIHALEDEKADLQSRLSAMESSTSGQLKAMEENFAAVNAHLQDLKRENSGLVEKSRNMEAEHARIAVTVDTQNRALGEEKEKSDKMKRSYKKAVDELRSKYDDLKHAYQDMKISFDGSENSGKRIREEIHGLKASANEAMKTLDPILTHGSSQYYYAKGSDTRTLIDELAQGRSQAIKVTEHLRDKLHDMSTSLALAQNRVRELEEMERTVWKKWTEREDQLDQTSVKMESIFQTIRAKDENEINVLCEAQRMKEMLQQQEAKMERVTAEHKRVESELEEKLCEAEKRNRDLASTLENTSQKNQALIEEAKLWQATISSLRAEGAVIPKLKENVATLEGTVAELRKNFAGLTEELDTCREKLFLSETESKVANSKFSDANKRLTEMEKDFKAAKSFEPQLQAANKKLAVLQDRFDSQGMTLTLTKQNVGDLQERLVQSEASHTEKFAFRTAELQCQISALSDEKSSMTAKLQMAEEISDRLNSSLVNAKAEFERQIKEVAESHSKQMQSKDETMQALIEENKALQEVITQSKITLGRMQSQFDAELQKWKERETEQLLVQAEKETHLGEEIRKLNDLMVHGQKEVKRWEERAEKIEDRYRVGDVTESERAFVASIMHMSRGMYEQDVVTKENELRRRENMITSLQAKIASLESTLAKRLHEQGQEAGGAARPILEFDCFMSSSPLSQILSQHSSQGRAPLAKQTLDIPQSKPTATIRTSSDQIKVSIHGSSPRIVQPTFAKLNATDDDISDDDTPPGAGRKLSSPTSMHKRNTAGTTKKDNNCLYQGNVIQRNRPGRRSKTVAVKKIELVTNRKINESQGTKLKSRRRK